MVVAGSAKQPVVAVSTHGQQERRAAPPPTPQGFSSAHKKRARSSQSPPLIMEEGRLVKDEDEERDVRQGTPAAVPALAPLATLSPIPTQQPITRQTSRASRIGAALAHVGSHEAYPPVTHHAHFEDDEVDREQVDTFSNRLAGRDGAVTGESESGTTGRGGGGGGVPVLDIEHAPCDDDPREWSRRKKNGVFIIITVAMFGPLIAPSIYNPVIDDVKSDLGATDGQIGLSLSMYILFQGGMPLFWASTAEIFGRKIVYLISYGIYTVAAVIASRSPNMPTLIGMRILQASGSAAVTAIGAGSLADIYEIHERGTRLGLYYGMPLIAGAVGPLIGGALGNSFGWRSCYYFLSAFAGVMEVVFLFFPDTWRRERSVVYQKALSNAIKKALHAEEKKARKMAKGLDSSAPTPATTQPSSYHGSRRNSHSQLEEERRQVAEEDVVAGAGAGAVGAGEGMVEVSLDREKNEVVVAKKSKGWGLMTRLKRKGAADEAEGSREQVRPTIMSINPFPTMLSIFKMPTNAMILSASGILFGAQYTIPFTASVTLAAKPYSYSPLIIGVVVLSFGVGSIIGSFAGGRYSDITLARLKKANGGVSVPEMRLRCTVIAMPLCVASFLAYAWTAGKKVHIAGLVVTLAFCGLSLMRVLIYSSTLAYLVDSNPGRSASAVSCNSFMRGSVACILSQVAIPIQKAIGDGGLYSIIAGLLAISCCMILSLIWKGGQWRAAFVQRKAAKTKQREESGKH